VIYDLPLITTCFILPLPFWH